MADILSQDEINALIEAYKATGSAEDSARGTQDRQVRLYDFSRPDKFCKEHLRSLNLIHSKHGALLSVALAAMMRVDVQVNLLALDQLTFREYCASVPDATLFVEAALEPLASIAVFEFNPSMVGMCVDLLAGAASVSASPGKVTEVDKAVMRPIIDLSLRKYAEAWSSSVDFKPRVVSVTTESTTRQVLLPSEGVLVCGYEISIAESVSMMSICIPASSIEMVLPALALGKPLSSQSQRSDTVNEALRRTFEEVEVECRAILGRTALSLEDVMGLEVGDLVRLPAKIHEPAEFWVENVPTFGGSLGRSGRNLAIKITGALDPPGSAA
jgi:flagellar motor switch protein FliM